MTTYRTAKPEADDMTSNSKFPTRPDIDAIEKLAAATPEGPWEPYDGYGPKVYPKWIGVMTSRLGASVCQSVGGDNVSKRADTAAFIANARTDVPALIAYVRELEINLTNIYELLKANRVGQAVTVLDNWNWYDVKK